MALEACLSPDALARLILDGEFMGATNTSDAEGLFGLCPI